MKRFVIALVLTCSLTVTAWAGDQHTPGAPAPEETVPGEIHTPGGPAPATEPGDGHTPGAPAPDGGEVHTPGRAEMILALVSLMFG
jgi:hypothetical protein